MEILEFTPRVGKAQAMSWEPMKLMPIGDVQAGIQSCDLDLLQRNIERGLQEDAWFIGLGDYLDVASPSNRRAYRAAGFYDSIHEAMDAHMRQEEEKLLEILLPTRNRWLGMVEGHHTWEYQNGTTTDINICNALNTKFLGHSALIRIPFKDGSRHSTSCTIFVHHGVGSGQSSGSPLTKLEKVLEWAEADLYIIGHQHKRVSANVPRFYLTTGPEPKLLARERLLVGAGSYLKGYMQESNSNGRPGGTYVEQALMRPVGLGSPLITIIPTRVRDTYTVEFEALT